MPGLWEFPSINPAEMPETTPILTVRHAIMQVNYTVHVHAQDARQLPIASGERQWFSAQQAASIALTGLARKILAKVGLIRATHNSPSIARKPIREVL